MGGGRKRSRSSCGTEADLRHGQKRRPSPVQDMQGRVPAPLAEGALSGEGNVVHEDRVCAEAVDNSETQTCGKKPNEDWSLSTDPQQSIGDADITVGDSSIERLRSLSIDDVEGDEAVMAAMGFSGFGAGQR